MAQQSQPSTKATNAKLSEKEKTQETALVPDTIQLLNRVSFNISHEPDENVATVGNTVNDWWNGPVEMLLGCDWKWTARNGETRGKLVYGPQGKVGQPWDDNETWSDPLTTIHVVGPYFTLVHGHIVSQEQTRRLCYVLETKRRQ